MGEAGPPGLALLEAVQAGREPITAAWTAQGNRIFPYAVTRPGGDRAAGTGVGPSQCCWGLVESASW